MEASRALGDIGRAHEEKYADNILKEKGFNHHIAHVFIHTATTFNSISNNLAEQQT